MGSRKLLWPTVLGLFSVIVGYECAWAHIHQHKSPKIALIFNILYETEWLVLFEGYDIGLASKTPN